MVVAPTPVLVRSFGALIPLQPVRWTAGGLVCAPDLAPEPVWDCPLPMRAVPRPALVADRPARLLAGWYHRSDVHAPAPAGFPELVQPPGEGFGMADHPTTGMCLAAIWDLPDTDALDIGCGAGLLTLAWCQAKRGRASGFDADPHAIAHARRSAALHGLDGEALFTTGRIEALTGADLTGRTLLVNLPPVAHDVLATRLEGSAPRAAVLSGFTARDRDRVLDPYRRLGLRRVRVMRRGRYECHVLVDGGSS